MIEERVHLREIAFARSGDKGNNANIALFANCQEGYEFLKETLTSEVVLDFFKDLGVKEVIRYEVPNLNAFNFILIDALGGGGISSLRIDAQGKALGQSLLDIKITIPEVVLCHCRR